MTGLRNIYVVDDDMIVRQSLETLISLRRDAVCHGFASGDAFLAVADTLQPGCLLLDLHMPGASGIDVLAALAGHEAKFRAIILTGQGDVTLAVAAMKAGAVDFLEKPCPQTALMGAIDKAFERLEHCGAETTRTAAAQAKLAPLSSREQDVLNGLIAGRSNKTIAFDLSISPRTVEIYRAKLMEKLEVRSLSEVLAIAFAAGLFPRD